MVKKIEGMTLEQRLENRTFMCESTLSVEQLLDEAVKAQTAWSNRDKMGVTPEQDSQRTKDDCNWIQRLMMQINRTRPQNFAIISVELLDTDGKPIPAAFVLTGSEAARLAISQFIATMRLAGDSRIWIAGLRMYQVDLNRAALPDMITQFGLESLLHIDWVSVRDFYNNPAQRLQQFLSVVEEAVERCMVKSGYLETAAEPQWRVEHPELQEKSMWEIMEQIEYTVDDYQQVDGVADDEDEDIVEMLTYSKNCCDAVHARFPDERIAVIMFNDHNNLASCGRRIICCRKRNFEHPDISGVIMGLSEEMRLHLGLAVFFVPFESKFLEKFCGCIGLDNLLFMENFIHFYTAHDASVEFGETIFNELQAVLRREISGSVAEGVISRLGTNNPDPNFDFFRMLGYQE